MKVIKTAMPRPLSNSQVISDVPSLDHKDKRIEYYLRTRFEERSETKTEPISNSLRVALLLAWAPKDPADEPRDENEDTVIEFEEYLLPEFLPEGAVTFNTLLNGEQFSLLKNLEMTISRLVHSVAKVHIELGAGEMIAYVDIGRYTAKAHFTYATAEKYFKLPPYEKEMI